MNCRVSIILLFMFHPFQWVLAQDILDLEDYRSRYPEEAAIYLENSRLITINIQGDSIRIFAEQTERILHLTSNSKSLAKDKVHSSFFVQTLSIDAQTLIPNGEEYTVMKVEDFVEKDESSSGVFYDDSKSTSFIFPGVKPGSITELHYRQEILDPRFLNAFYFQTFLPVESSELVLKVNKDISINTRIFNQGDLIIDYKKVPKGKFIEHIWQSKNVSDIKFEQDIPSISYFAPHLIYYVSQFRIGKEEKTILNEVNDLFKWYANFTSHLNEPANGELKTTVNEITRGLESSGEKVKAIFYWVQDNIKYIAFEEGMRGFIPHDADYIYSNRYGDCKDMACITRSMLNLAGIESHFTWIGSRDIPYTYEEVPTPIVDNHMITTYYEDGEVIFLDATSKHTQYGLPSSMIQGKQALVQMGPDSFRLEIVPVIDKEINYILDSAYLTLEGHSLSGNGILKEGGYEKVYDSYRLAYASGSRVEDFVKSKVSRASNKFLLNNFELENVEDKDLPLTIEYNFEIQDYHKEIGDEIYLNLNLKKPFYNQFIDVEKRRYPIEEEFKYQHEYITVLKVPDGYSVTYLPENSTFQNQIAGFSVNYKLFGDKIILKNTVFVDYLILEPEDFSKWNDVVNNINEVYSDALILKKK